MKKIIVTIDGPAASGKEKIAKFISRKWNLDHLDSGVLYRQIALSVKKNGVNPKSEKDIGKLINTIKKLSFKKNKNLRTEEISKISSKIAVFGSVRNFVNQFQRKYTELKNNNNKGYVIDGRDIGSVVFKKADLKLYIDVNEENRAKRRYKQLIDTGEKSIYPQILKEIKLRDKKDMNRKNSPLIIPRGAIIIDNNDSFLKTKNQIKNSFKKLKIWTKLPLKFLILNTKT